MPNQATAGGNVDERVERGDRTRERLLEATIESLVEVGYRRSSMREICERAGVSRGSQLHHYPTKAKLVTSAVEYLARAQGERLRAASERLPRSPEWVEAMVEVIWEAFSGSLGRAFIELWTASATEPELHEVLLPVDRELKRTTIEVIEPGEGEDPGVVDTLFWLSATFLRGLALDGLMGGNEQRREHLFTVWKSLIRQAMHLQLESSPDYM